MVLIAGLAARSAMGTGRRERIVRREIGPAGGRKGSSAARAALPTRPVAPVRIRWTMVVEEQGGRLVLARGSEVNALLKSSWNWCWARVLFYALARLTSGCKH